MSRRVEEQVEHILCSAHECCTVAQQRMCACGKWRGEPSRHRRHGAPARVGELRHSHVLGLLLASTTPPRLRGRRSCARPRPRPSVVHRTRAGSSRRRSPSATRADHSGRLRTAAQTPNPPPMTTSTNPARRGRPRRAATAIPSPGLFVTVKCQPILTRETAAHLHAVVARASAADDRHHRCARQLRQLPSPAGDVQQRWRRAVLQRRHLGTRCSDADSLRLGGAFDLRRREAA